MVAAWTRPTQKQPAVALKVVRTGSGCARGGNAPGANEHCLRQMPEPQTHEAARSKIKYAPGANERYANARAANPRGDKI